MKISSQFRFLLAAGVVSACATGAGVAEDPNVDLGDASFVSTPDLGSPTRDAASPFRNDAGTTAVDSGSMTQTCQAPLLPCGGGCVNVQINPTHCGMCDNPCATGQACQAGACTAPSSGCAAPQVMCSGGCTDPNTDRANCGGCGFACGTGQTCRSGACTSSTTPTDAGTVRDSGTSRDSGGATTPPTGPGTGCNSDADCFGAHCITDAEGWSGGYCTISCSTSADCGDGVCAGSSTSGICLAVCRTNSDCRSGYRCQPGTTVPGFCVPRCSYNAAVLCGEYRCDTTTDQCTGPRCTSASQCSTGSTCTNRYCDCTAATDCGAGRSCDPATRSCQ